MHRRPIKTIQFPSRSPDLTSMISSVPLWGPFGLFPLQTSALLLRNENSTERVSAAAAFKNPEREKSEIPFFPRLTKRQTVLESLDDAAQARPSWKSSKSMSYYIIPNEVSGVGFRFGLAVKTEPSAGSPRAPSEAAGSSCDDARAQHTSAPFLGLVCSQVETERVTHGHAKECF